RDIAVTVSDGSVTLRGDVGTWSQRQAAGVIANETPGVWRVFNDIRVDGHPCPSNDRRELPVPTGGPGG
ncbi:MAG: BON domain-containing protein, partial [Planctomycetes bacterium]|nr:BON domain-containing protein [Planctomycetota bacterium]